MDELRADDRARAREVPDEERAFRALAAIREGIALKRVALRQRFPALDADGIEGLLRRWLRRD